MEKRLLYCYMGADLANIGNMADRSQFHWIVVGQGYGSTLQDVADNVALNNRFFASMYCRHEKTYWGQPLSINPTGVVFPDFSLEHAFGQIEMPVAHVYDYE